MPVSFASMDKLFGLGLSTEQLKGVMEVLAVELAPLEERRNKDRLRKRQRESTDGPQKIHGTSVESPQIARNVDINSLPSETIKTNLPLSPSKPEPDGFDAFWACYPKRSGAADRKAAVKAFGPAVKRADLETILHGARAYNSEMTAKGKIGTEFVKQARTWLNADGWTEYQSSSPLASVERPSGVYVKYGTDAGDAWERHYRVVLKKVPPRDFKGGWWHPTEYPEERSAA